MRKLTIKREKRFVACLGAMKVYIEDSTANDLTINGVACRKLGKLKNGEEKTFEVGCEAARIFVIADRLSKSYCNEYYNLPSGEEDITLTGKNKFNPLTGNAFRFDGVTDAGVLENRSDGVQKGTIVMSLVFMIAFFAGFILSGGAIIAETLKSFSKPQTFSSYGMSITLNGSFEEVVYDDCTVAYESDYAGIFASKYEFADNAGFEAYTVREYGEMVLEASGLKTLLKTQLETYEDLTYFEYTTEDCRYYAFIFKTDDAFWLVQFAVFESDVETYEAKVFEWAKTITFD